MNSKHLMTEKQAPSSRGLEFLWTESTELPVNTGAPSCPWNSDDETNSALDVGFTT